MPNLIEMKLRTACISYTYSKENYTFDNILSIKI